MRHMIDPLDFSVQEVENVGPGRQHRGRPFPLPGSLPV